MLELTGMQIAAILFAVSVPLSVAFIAFIAFIALIGRLNGKDEDNMVEGYEPPKPEHVVDIRAVNQRYAEE